MSATAAAYQDYGQRGGFADLSARTKLRFTGGDRIRYVNGQVTANVSSLRPGAAIPACVTTAKGKLSADAFISMQGEAVLLDAEAELREPLSARLERYIIADDVALEDVTEEFALFHVLATALPENAVSSECSVTKARRYGQDGFDVLAPASSGSEVQARLAKSFATLSPELLEIIRIQHGVPRWGHELGEDTLPPEAGLDRTHVDYHKGCYIGQEVISRLKSVGHANRQLLGFLPLSGDGMLARGMRLFSPADPARQVGTLTSAAWSFALAKPIALGYLKRGSPTDDLIALPPHADTPVIHVAARELPFIS